MDEQGRTRDANRRVLRDVRRDFVDQFQQVAHRLSRISSFIELGDTRADIKELVQLVHKIKDTISTLLLFLARLDI